MLIDLELDNDSNFGSETRAVCLGKALLGSMARVTKVVKLDGLAKVGSQTLACGRGLPKAVRS